MSSIYRADETWPTHQKPWWGDALAAARKAGWTLNYVDAPHRFGIVFCPGEIADRHSFNVDKTAKSGEKYAIEAKKLLRNCRHASAAPGSKVRDRRQECERLLGEVERLIAMADRGLAQAEAGVAALTDLERLEVQLQTAEAGLAELLGSEYDSAWLAALDAEDAPEPDAIGAILDDAEAAVVGAETVATALKLRKPKLAQPFLDRARAARMQIGTLKARLGAL